MQEMPAPLSLAQAPEAASGDRPASRARYKTVVPNGAVGAMICRAAANCSGARRCAFSVASRAVTELLNAPTCTAQAPMPPEALTWVAAEREPRKDCRTGGAGGGS